MSTILDSLKKSSEQRDNNDKAAINNFNFGSGKRPSKSRFLVVIVLVVITAAILYFGYNYLYNNDEPAPVEVAQLPETVSNQIQANDPKKQKPNSSAVKQQLQDIQAQRQQQDINKSQSIADLNRPKPIKDSENMTTRTNSPTQTTEKQVEQLPEVQTQQAKMPDSKDKNNTLSQNMQPETKPAHLVKQQKHLLIYQLPFSIRKDIPKFKLNIHIYDENPQNRLAVINGVKFVINDMIEEQVLVKDIVAEGILLEFNGQEFLVPKL